MNTKVWSGETCFHPLRWRCIAIEANGMMCEMSDGRNDMRLSKAVRIEAQGALDLARIHAVFKTSVSELASILGIAPRDVDRLQVAGTNDSGLAARLAGLAQAADIIQSAGFAEHSYALRRALPGGGTLFDRICSGDQPVKSAEELVAMLRKEKSQRDALRARLSLLRTGPIDMSEVGLPMLIEKI